MINVNLCVISLGVDDCRNQAAQGPGGPKNHDNSGNTPLMCSFEFLVLIPNAALNITAYVLNMQFFISLLVTHLQISSLG